LLNNRKLTRPTGSQQLVGQTLAVLAEQQHPECGGHAVSQQSA